MELDILPPMAQRALWRPVAAPPVMAILALIMAMNVDMPYTWRGLALERMGETRGLSWALMNWNSCLELLMKALKRGLKRGKIWPGSLA